MVLVVAEGGSVTRAEALVSVAAALAVGLPRNISVVRHAAAPACGGGSGGGGTRVVQTRRGFGKVRGVAAGVGPNQCSECSTIGGTLNLLC